MEATKQDWIDNKAQKEAMIVGNKMQIEMAEALLKFIDQKIAEFPAEEEKTPLGV
jgi:CO dehydrogenase/acetyl-CoA synthase epsilon subunit